MTRRRASISIPRRRFVAAATSVLLAATACSSDGDATVTTAAPVAEPVTTTDEATTTTEASTTTEATTTTTEATTTTTAAEATTTTEAAPTTSIGLDPDIEDATLLLDSDAVAEAVTETIEQFESDVHDCLASLPACDPAATVATTNGGFRSGVQAELEEWVDLGYIAENSDRYSIEVESVAHTPADSVAFATICIQNQYVIVSPESGETIQDANRFSRFDYQVRFVEGEWFINASRSVEVFDGEGDGCVV